MSKRKNREIIELKKIYKNIEILGNIIIIDNKKFILAFNYPFTQPILFINLKPYITFLTTANKKINLILIEHFNINCICCTSILCPTNWNPKYTINDILNEILYVNTVKSDIKYFIYIKKICDKYNLPMYKDIFNYLIINPLVDNPSLSFQL